MSRYILGVIPHPRRRPSPLGDWWRLGLVVVLVAAAILAVPWAWNRLGCRDGFPSSGIWESGGKCIGLSDSDYAFGIDEFAPVLKVIDKQNKSAGDRCDPAGTPATVGILIPMTDRLVGSRAVHELEGMAAAQRQANGTGCLHPLRLVLGHIGDYGRNDDAAEVTRELAARPEVIAVVGMGLSEQRSADVADILAAAKIPMVSDVITAEGFDQSGSRDDHPDFGGCAPGITYPRGIGRDYFYRVAFRASKQIAPFSAAGVTAADFIMVPTGGSDPYTCTALPLMQRHFGGNVTEVKFDADEASTVPQTAKRVCGVSKDVTVAYVARGYHLARFLQSLDEAFSNGQCAASSITVVSTSDGQRLRTAEADPTLEGLRLAALRSNSFTTGKMRLLSALVGGGDRSLPGNPNFSLFEQAFTDAG
ncbi:ABC transporter substrate-binding protein, partial [Amycolatopsis sp. NPDC059021]|uniref:ABC transporter substrate-binding protein n=1 Tax=Amycolatopsis sp. NPDC059021 TaxID=3346704 RepID=UPI0036715779